MSDIVERLHVIRNHFRTGALGQREAWEEWLTEAATEFERLRTQCGGTCRYWEERWRDEKADNEQLRAALKEISEFPPGGYTAAGAMAIIARAALEPKP